ICNRTFSPRATFPGFTFKMFIFFFISEVKSNLLLFFSLYQLVVERLMTHRKFFNRLFSLHKFFKVLSNQNPHLWMLRVVLIIPFLPQGLECTIDMVNHTHSPLQPILLTPRLGAMRSMRHPLLPLPLPLL